MAAVEHTLQDKFPDVEAAMDAAWPSLERSTAGGWVLRAADGVTQRANSVWPDSREAPQDWPAQLRSARSWYRSRRLPVIFQVFGGTRNAALHEFLDAEGFTRQSETLVMTRGRWHGAGELPGAVELSTEPPAEWLQLWWGVDGRGGADALETARAILVGCPSVYALVRDDGGRPAAVERLALPAGQWGGIYCMATHPDGRRRGYGSTVLTALLQAGAARGLDGYWLLATAANDAAQRMYARAGFRESGRYLYRQEKPRRALSGC